MANSPGIAEIASRLGFERDERHEFRADRNGQRMVIRKKGAVLRSPKEPLLYEVQDPATGKAVRVYKYPNFRQLVKHEMPEMLEEYDRIVPPPRTDEPKPASPKARAPYRAVRSCGPDDPNAPPPVPTEAYKARIREIWKGVIRAVAALPDRQA